MTTAFLIVLAGVALCLCYVLIAPFFKTVVFSAVLVIIFYPAYARICRWIQNRNIAAAVATAALLLVISSISLFLGRALIEGLRDTYESLTGAGASKERLSVFIVEFVDRAITWLSHYLPISVPTLQTTILKQTENAVSTLLTITAGLVGSLSALGLKAVIAIVVLFFLFRDGKAMLRRLSVILPLNPDQARRLFTRIKDTLDAIVYGTLAMAAIQGTLTGLGFWFLGLTSPVLWGLVAAFLAVFPVVGTTCVWGPAVCLLFFGGHWIKAVVLLVWGLAVVHPVDNILRPYLIGSRAKLSVLYVFFAVVGGLKAFGVLGLFIGPLILAVTVALLTFVREESRSKSWSLKSPSRMDEEIFDQNRVPHTGN
ncbi:MAG TPA: AI-2E family transporter [Candidatus Sulfotelmatobacter sp.]|nr:AI-2E family transporter [Candidatus Sulfotelmatobacter sp.]